MKLITQKLTYLLGEWTWQIDDNVQHERLHEEIKRLSLENELLKKGNWFTAYMVGIASKRLLKLYDKAKNIPPIKLDLVLPENEK